jgi:O-acetyl-ADP-ribose deacetylase (regulator of RNase III)
MWNQMYSIKIVRGNIVNVTTEAIVNPANNNLMPGGGANKMIFYAAGDKLIESCSKFKYCETGKAIYTQGFNIPAKYIIHAVGPYWHGGYNNEAQDLASCYISIMKIAESLGLKSLAIPALCTGRGGYPLDEAIDIAVSSVVSYLQSHNLDMEIWFMCYDHETLLRYRAKNMDGVNDVTQYFNRKTIKLKGKLSKKEKKILKKKLFKKEITKEQEREAMELALKRLLKKKYPDVIYLAPPKTKDSITLKTCVRYECSGPFVTTDCVLDYSYDNEKINIEIQPYSFLDTPDEIESKKKYFIDDNENSIPDQFEGANQSSYNQAQKILKVANIESMLSSISEGNEVTVEYVDVEKTDVKIEDISTAEDELIKNALDNAKATHNIYFNEDVDPSETDEYGVRPTDYIELLYEENLDNYKSVNEKEKENAEVDEPVDELPDKEASEPLTDISEKEEDLENATGETAEVETITLENDMVETEVVDAKEIEPVVLQNPDNSDLEIETLNCEENNKESNLYIENNDYADVLENTSAADIESEEEYCGQISDDNTDNVLLEESVEKSNISQITDNLDNSDIAIIECDADDKAIAETFGDTLDISVDETTDETVDGYVDDNDVEVIDENRVEDCGNNSSAENNDNNNPENKNQNKNQYKKSKKDYRPNYNKYKKKEYYNKKSKK